MISWVHTGILDEERQPEEESVAHQLSEEQAESKLDNALEKRSLEALATHYALKKGRETNTYGNLQCPNKSDSLRVLVKGAFPVGGGRLGDEAGVRDSVVGVTQMGAGPPRPESSGSVGLCVGHARVGDDAAAAVDGGRGRRRNLG